MWRKKERMLLQRIKLRDDMVTSSKCVKAFHRGGNNLSSAATNDRNCSKVDSYIIRLEEQIICEQSSSLKHFR